MPRRATISGRLSVAPTSRRSTFFGARNDAGRNARRRDGRGRSRLPHHRTPRPTTRQAGASICTRVQARARRSVWAAVPFAGTLRFGSILVGASEGVESPQSPIAQTPRWPQRSLRTLNACPLRWCPAASERRAGRQEVGILRAGCEPEAQARHAGRALRGATGRVLRERLRASRRPLRRRLE
jgi:hypothetical protein